MCHIRRFVVPISACRSIAREVVNGICEIVKTNMELNQIKRRFVLGHSEGKFEIALFLVFLLLLNLLRALPELTGTLAVAQFPVDVARMLVVGVGLFTLWHGS